jgi:2-keto-4-pentenoate hydratase/2-oxohepta-3-ene-1,7-dioic acid hydratase in catechol pathway
MGSARSAPVSWTTEEIVDPQALRVRCWVNEELMQDAGTHDMLFSVRNLIAYISQFMTLEPGDVIATGTPAGIGAFRTPPRWLQPGDRVRADISGIGSLDIFIG